MVAPVTPLYATNGATALAVAVRAQAHNVYYIIQIITVYATALLICNHIMTQNPAKGAARDWENIVGFPAGGDERGKVTP